MEITVVFPAPLGPSRPKISPSEIEILKSFTAGRDAPEYIFVRPRVNSNPESGNLSVTLLFSTTLYITDIPFRRNQE
jgi:hypothetical protein